MKERKVIAEKKNLILNLLKLNPKITIKPLTRLYLKATLKDPNKVNYDDFLNEMNKIRYVLNLLIKDGKTKITEIESQRGSVTEKKVYEVI